MNKIRLFISRSRLRLRGKNKIVGWEMTPDETRAFFTEQGKTILTFFGFSAGYEDEEAMLQIVQEFLKGYSTKTTIVNIGATRAGIGAVYPLAKSLGFTTTGIVSTLALEYPGDISEDVDYVCFIDDDQWGGNLSESDELSPTSEAMVACSDILVAIGGGKISRDELLAAKARGKPVFFYPAEIEHERAIRSAKKQGLPPPDSFWGAAHEALRKKDKEA